MDQGAKGPGIKWHGNLGIHSTDRLYTYKPGDEEALGQGVAGSPHFGKRVISSLTGTGQRIAPMEGDMRPACHSRLGIPGGQSLQLIGFANV